MSDNKSVKEMSVSSLDQELRLVAGGIAYENRRAITKGGEPGNETEMRYKELWDELQKRTGG